jgi:hypothetical protein
MGRLHAKVMGIRSFAPKKAGLGPFRSAAFQAAAVLIAPWRDIT